MAGRRRFVGACVVAVIVAAGIQLTLLLSSGGLARPDAFANFYDIQGRAFLRGDLAVPDGSLSFEGFVIDGRTYQYFGPLPAVARMPILALTDRWDGRLTGPSMVLAWLTLAWAAPALLWRIRSLARGRAEVTRCEAALAGLLVLGLLGGSVVVFLTARPVIYHEAELWGMALATASAWATVGLAAKPTAARAGLTGLLVAATMLTRSSVGLGAIAGVGGVAGVMAWRWWRDRARPGSSLMPVVAVGLAALVPLAAGIAVNQAKFATPFGIPIEAQIFSTQDQHRREMLAANDGRYFRLAFAPTTALQYLRPDGFGLNRVFPFIEIPDREPTHVGSIVLDERNPTPSIWTSYPLWGGLALLGAGALVARLRRPDRLFTTVGPIVVGTAVGVAGVLTIGYIGTRYLADFLPTLALLSAVGTAVLWGHLDGSRAGERRWIRRGIVGAAALLTAIAMAGNIAIAATERYTTSSPARLRSWLTVLERVDEAGPGVLADRTTVGQAPPPRGGTGELFISGDCRSLYWSDGTALANVKPTNWRRVEGTTDAGHYRIRVSLDPLAPGQSVPILVAGTAEDQTVVRIEGVDADHVRVVMDDPRVPRVGDPVEWTPGHIYDLELSADPAIDQFELWRGDQRLLANFYARPETARVGPAAVTDGPFPGTWEALADDTRLCERIRTEAR